VNNEILKSNTIKKDEVIYIPDETPYSILLENNSNIIADVFIKIDGKKMGVYRLVPNEKYELNRPIRRKKNLIFLKKKEEYKKTNLFTEDNKESGIVEAEFKTGVINIKHKKISNKKVFRPETEGYIPEYMNIYKNKKKNENEKDKKIEELIKNQEEKYVPERGTIVQPECEIHSNEIHSNEIDECSNECSNGFTVYGDKIDNKFKTYHELLYDGNLTNIKLVLQCNGFYQKL